MSSWKDILSVNQVTHFLKLPTRTGVKPALYGLQQIEGELAPAALLSAVLCGLAMTAIDQVLSATLDEGPFFFTDAIPFFIEEPLAYI